jgi:hypothetical protein
MAENRSETSLLVVFVGLTRFASQSQRVGDLELAEGSTPITSRSAHRCRPSAGANRARRWSRHLLALDRRDVREYETGGDKPQRRESK